VLCVLVRSTGRGWVGWDFQEVGGGAITYLLPCVVDLLVEFLLAVRVVPAVYRFAMPHDCTRPYKHGEGPSFH